MQLQKFRLVLLVVICASAILVLVPPARAVSSESEPPPLFTKNVTALDALDAFDSPATAESVAAENTSAEKPAAPAPKIATDSDVAQQSTSTSSANSEQKPTGPPSNPTGSQDDNPK